MRRINTVTLIAWAAIGFFTWTFWSMVIKMILVIMK